MLVAVGAVTMLVLLLFDVRVEVGEKPASADGEAVDVQPGTGLLLARPTDRRFAWAPTAGASGYHVEFFRGSKRVYARDTTRPLLTVPAEWALDGTKQYFRPGEYGWYVWPIVGGVRQSHAVVQTVVSIPQG